MIAQNISAFHPDPPAVAESAGLLGGLAKRLLVASAAATYPVPEAIVPIDVELSITHSLGDGPAGSPHSNPYPAAVWNKPSADRPRKCQALAKQLYP